MNEAKCFICTWIMTDFKWEIWEGSVLVEVLLHLINEHSIMVQKCFAIAQRWKSLASVPENGLKCSQLSVIASPRYAAWSECNSCFRNNKILEGSGGPVLIWMLPVQCRNCFSLFEFVPVMSSLCILTLNFDVHRVYHIKPIHLTHG